MRRALLLALWCALQGHAYAAATLGFGPTSVDTLPLVTLFPPALELHPTDPDLAWVARSINQPSVLEVDVTPAQTLVYSGRGFVLASGHDCSPGPAATPFIGNLWLENVAPGVDRGWVVAPVCEIVIPFDLVSGDLWSVSYESAPRDEVPATRTISGSFTQYQDGGGGALIASFDTDHTASVLRVGGRLLIATSNIDTPGSNPVFNPGTVLLFDILDTPATRSTTVTPASPPYLVTSDPDPIALTALPGGLVVVTNAGIHDTAFPPLVLGEGSIDVIDPAAGVLLGSLPIGAGNPGGRTLAVDPSGSVAVASSRTVRELFAFDVRGLGDLPDPGIDPTLQRPSCNDVAGALAGGLPCLRERVIHGGANPLTIGPPPGVVGDSSFMPEVRFSKTGEFVAATSFNDGGLALVAFDSRNLDRPHPLLPSRFGPPETLAATSPGGPLGAEGQPGPMVLHANTAGGSPGGDVYFATGSPNGLLVRGALGGSLADPNGDFDGDGVEDALDVCPLIADPLQLDQGGVGPGAPADGVGDRCQCADVDGDGEVLIADQLALRIELAGGPPVAFLDKCDVSGDGLCDIVDVALSARGVAGLDTLAQVCAPAVL